MMARSPRCSTSQRHKFHPKKPLHPVTQYRDSPDSRAISIPGLPSEQRRPNPIPSHHLILLDLNFSGLPHRPRTSPQTIGESEGYTISIPLRYQSNHDQFFHSRNCYDSARCPFCPPLHRRIFAGARRRSPLPYRPRNGDQHHIPLPRRSRAEG